ncbi:hypothetical protein SDC9_114887 [bioreactor metagenome]|uniref:DUF4363 family protein n=1 Tax=bioreactor metagenome TaxID=1076179 RepID=A0A645BRV9_9ZZZZ
MARLIAIIIAILFLLFLFIFPPLYVSDAQKTFKRELETAYTAAMDEDWVSASGAYEHLYNDFHQKEKVFKLFFDHEDIDLALESVGRAGVALTLQEKADFISELSTFESILTYVTDIEHVSLHDIF